MAASAKRRKAESEPEHFVQRGVAALGGFISRNPAAVGGSTAFIVSMLYVSANAIWYQPHAHTEPLFATRAFETFIDPKPLAERAQPQTTINIERQGDAPPPPRLSDPVVERVQRILGDLGFYAGDVDGIKGPATSQAVEAYQRKMGLTESGVIDQELLEQLGADDTTGAIVPSPRPTDTSGDAAPMTEKGALIAKIQKGLRAFGNKDIDVDGLLGTRTKAAIKEFQALFGLPQTGGPEPAVYAKMKEVKLVE
jgi:peptidoglycan hydrolase-like protein with peptidoglycan-binding domain